LIKNWNAAWIHGEQSFGVVAIGQVGLSGEDSEAEAAIQSERGRDAAHKSSVIHQRATAIGVFDAVEIRVGLILHARREVNAADEADRARGERSFVVAEESAGASKRNSDVIGILHYSEIPDCSGGSILRTEDAEDEAGAVHDGDTHVHIDCANGSVND